MDIAEFRDVLDNTENCIEVSENVWKLMCDGVKVNDIFSISNVSDIRIVNGTYINVWFNNGFHIELKDVEKIMIFGI